MPEQDENNNTAASVQITLTTQPGPTITDLTAGPADAIAEYVDVTFDGPIDAGSFALDDVALTDPLGGSVAVTGLSPLGGNSYRISFAELNLAGQYTITIGPDVTDPLGNPMNQDGSLPNGQPSDAFVGTFDVALPDLEADSVTPSKTDIWFGETIDVAWLVSNLGVVSASGSWLDRLWLSDDDQPGGDTSLVSLWCGYSPVIPAGTGGSSTQVTIPLDPALPEGTYYLILRVNATGSLAEADTDNNTAVSDAVTLSIKPGPSVISMAPQRNAAGAVGGVKVSFDVHIDPTSLTAADVSLIGPAGAVTVTGIAHDQNSTYLISFPTQETAGTYDLTVGPDVTDLFGSAMDQDGDGVNGDGFTGQFQIELPELVLDSVTPAQAMPSSARALT